MNKDFGLKGHVWRLELRKNWNFCENVLSHVPNLDTFDLEFSPAGSVLTKTSYTHSGAVHRLIRFSHDESGRLIRTQEFQSDGTLLEIAELSYAEHNCTWVSRDSRGAVTSHGVDEYNGSDLILSSSFDARNNLKKIKSFEYADGKLVRSISKYYGCDLALYEQWITTYDAAGRISKASGLEGDGSPLGDGKYVYEYDQEDRQAKVWTFNDWEDVACSVAISQYVNDDVGNWIERREFHRSQSDSGWSSHLTTRKLIYYPLS